MFDTSGEFAEIRNLDCIREIPDHLLLLSSVSILIDFPLRQHSPSSSPAPLANDNDKLLVDDSHFAMLLTFLSPILVELNRC